MGLCTSSYCYQPRTMSDTDKYSFKCLCGKCGFSAVGAPVRPRPPPCRSGRRRGSSRILQEQKKHVQGFCTGVSVVDRSQVGTPHRCVSSLHVRRVSPSYAYMSRSFRSLVLTFPVAPQAMAPLCHCHSCRVYGGGPAYVAAYMPDKVTHTSKEGERPPRPTPRTSISAQPGRYPAEKICGFVPHTQHVNSANSRSTRVRQSELSARCPRMLSVSTCTQSSGPAIGFGNVH